MAGSTGPILAAGAITAFNAVIIHDKPLETQIPTAVGTAIAAAGLALIGRALPGAATAFAWLVLVAVLFTRIDPLVPSPLESVADWYNGK